MSTTVEVTVSDSIATITFNRPRSLNAITKEDYDAFANALRDIDKRSDVLVTIWQATGKFFCAGTDVKNRSGIVPTNVREAFMSGVVPTALECSQALYTHSKVLVAALNGPVLGVAAALLGFFDFIYCTPNAWLAVPFTFLGIISEAGSSVTFVNRMGLATANEVLLWGKKKDAQQLLSCGFVNEIIPATSTEQFNNAVRDLVLRELEGLDPAAILAVKKLIKAGLHEKNNPDAVNLREGYAQAERFASGVPFQQFMRIAQKEIKHKL